MGREVVVITRPQLSAGLKLLQKAAGEFDYLCADDRQEALQLIERADIIYGTFDSEMLKRTSGLKWVQVVSAGVDYLPQQEMAQRGIILTNMRGLHANTAADHVMALILTHSRALAGHVRNQQTRDWDRSGRSCELAGMTMGVIGLGSIGREIARRAAGFRMTVLGIQRRPKQEVEFTDELFAPSQMQVVLKRSDVLVIACPLTSETEGLIGAEELAMLPQQAFVVNIARGEIIDQPSLIGALQQDDLGGAGLDVFADEPLPPDSPLWGMSNVVITPHVAGRQSNYAQKAARRFAENLRRYRDGRPLKWQVDYQLQY